LEARTALLPPEAVVEPDAQPEVVAAAVAAVAAEPDAQPEAAVAVAAAELDAQREAAVAVAAAEPDAQPEAAVAVAAVQPDAQPELAVAAAAKLRVRPPVPWVEMEETAVVRFWIRAAVFSAPAREPQVVSAA
jgi:hypothetical protein